MPLIAHTLYLTSLSEKEKSTLKRICQDWTQLDQYSWYVLHHSDALKKSCPLCVIKGDS